jgi:protein-disulfide isomerase
MIVDKYVRTGRLLFIFRHYPLVAVHPQAYAAAIIAECAGQQGHFWSAHDRLFEPRDQWPSDRERLAAAAGLSSETVANCSLEAAERAVRDGMDEAAALKFSGTPSFAIGRNQDGRNVIVDSMIVGEQQLSTYEHAIDSSLRRRSR